MGHRSVLVAVIVLVGVIAVGCGDSGASGGEGGGCGVDESYAPVIDPASFVAGIDHPLLPLTPGTAFSYDGGPGVVVTTEVLTETKTILGVTCVVVHDYETDAGDLVEDTYDWFAQDADGNVWYFGEDTKELEMGTVTSTHGSWEAGKDGAQPGIVMQAMPAPGEPYRQEYYACEAEDMAEVLSVDEAVTVAFGTFDGCLKTHEYTPLEPAVNEEKYYCPDVGLVLSVDVVTGGREELTAKTP